MMENYFSVLDQAGNAAEAAAAEITGYKTYADLLEAFDTPQTVLANTRRASASCRACCGGSASLPNRTKSCAPRENKILAAKHNEASADLLPRPSPMAKLICSLGATLCPLSRVKRTCLLHCKCPLMTQSGHCQPLPLLGESGHRAGLISTSALNSDVMGVRIKLLSLDPTDITNCNHLPPSYCTAAFANYIGSSSDCNGGPKGLRRL